MILYNFQNNKLIEIIPQIGKSQKIKPKYPEKK